MVLLGVTVLTSHAQNTHTAEEYALCDKLFATMEMEQSMKDIVTKTVDIQLEGLPLPEASKTKLRPALMQFFDKYMSFDSLKEDMANLYLKYFTVKEIQELMKFMQTPAGKKFIKNQSKLFSEGAEIGAKRVKMHEAELTQMIMKALQD